MSFYSYPIIILKRIVIIFRMMSGSAREVELETIPGNHLSYSHLTTILMDRMRFRTCDLMVGASPKELFG